MKGGAQEMADYGSLRAHLVNPRRLDDYMQFRRESNGSLARKAGVSRTLISLLRNGRRTRCLPTNAAAIERALDAPAGALFLIEVPTSYAGATQLRRGAA